MWSLIVFSALLSQPAKAQSPISRDELALDWRRIGTATIDAGLPGLATGEVRRVWYSADGSTLYAQTGNGGIWETSDFETWTRTTLEQAPAVPPSAAVPARPEFSVRVARAVAAPLRYYAIGRFVYRSSDGGANWTNVTAYRNESILGEGLTDVAVSPANPDEITVSNAAGVWRSLDGGTTWAGLNDELPNLPARRLLALPNGSRPAKLALAAAIGDDTEIEWQPGERTAWRLSPTQAGFETFWRNLASSQLGLDIATAAMSGNWFYAGTTDGRIFASADGGQNWVPFSGPAGGAVEAIYIDPADGRIALAALRAGTGPRRNSPLVWRTMNGGRNWDDATGTLPATNARGIVADTRSGSIYVATDAGIFYATADLSILGPVSPWQRLGGSIAGQPALDVRLDEAGNQLFALIRGYGVYATMAPHRLRQLSLVHAANFRPGPAAPGTLLSILGAGVDRVRAGEWNVPVLANNEFETQVQVPFEARGEALSLTFDTRGRQQSLPVALANVSPAVFIDRDGAPLLLDADTGESLDVANPARPGARLQILATGLGAVNPPWPSGTPAPPGDAPRVVAPVRVFLDREPVEVLRATLAPGYIGFYLVEVRLPQLTNAGPLELFIEAGGQESNRVPVYLLP